MLRRLGFLLAAILRFITLRLIPLVVIVAIIWSGYQVAQAFTRQVDERLDYQGSKDNFADVATQIAVEVDQARIESPTLTATDLPTSPPATLTPEPTDTDVPPSDTPTLEPSSTATDWPTATAVPSRTATTSPSPVPSDMPERAQQQTTNTPRPALFATNTPRPVIFATNTPESGVEPTAASSPTPMVAATVTTGPTEAIVEAVPTATNTLPPFFAPRTAEPGTVINGVPVPTEVPLIPRENRNLFNIILLGGDGELTDDGSLRTDTMIIVSVNKDTNTVSMLSLPRDLFVYVPTESGAMERLNTVYGLAESSGWQPDAFDLLRQTIAYNFGINVHHYALVNFSGFEQIIDTLGGVEVAVDCAYQDYRLIGAELPEGATQSTEDEDLYTVDVGYYNMSGAQALWYARTRRSASDFDRGRRQQQILRAMYHRALDTGQLGSLPQLWGQVTDIVNTSVDVTDVIGLVPIALGLDASAIRSYTFTLTYHTQPLTVAGSDGVTANVQVPVYEMLRPMLEEFYRPPANNQLLLEGATIAIYNGTANSQWDLVAAQRLGWEGFRAVAMGEAQEAVDGTVLIDYTGQQKGSSLNQIAAILNVQPENIRTELDADRTADFQVILGPDYNSCTYDGVLPVDE